MDNYESIYDSSKHSKIFNKLDNYDFQSTYRVSEDLYIVILNLLTKKFFCFSALMAINYI